MPNFVVKYKLSGDQGRTPREITVEAKNQADAKKVAQAQLPGATIIGGPQKAK